MIIWYEKNTPIVREKIVINSIFILKKKRNSLIVYIETLTDADGLGFVLQSLPTRERNMAHGKRKGRKKRKQRIVP